LENMKPLPSSFIGGENGGIGRRLTVSGWS
jgi:hypothetical protein